MKAILRFFLSLKTAFVLFLMFILLAFIGSLTLTGNLAFFSGIDDAPLFKWLSSAGNLKLIWWIYAMILMLCFLAISTIFCTIEGLFNGIGRKNLALKLSPQIMHIGVLFIMLGHLLTASYGFKKDVLVKEGEGEQIWDKTTFRVEDILVTKDENGYDADWQVRLHYSEVWGRGEGILRPAHPVYFSGFGLYLKSVSMETEPSALIRVCADPGALWALIGGILLLGGGLVFIYGRFGYESP